MVSLDNINHTTHRFEITFKPLTKFVFNIGALPRGFQELMFFCPLIEQNIMFSPLYWGSEYVFLEKKHPHPLLEVKWSFP